MRLINAESLKQNLCIKFGNQLPNGLLDEIDKEPTINWYMYTAQKCNLDIILPHICESCSCLEYCRKIKLEQENNNG